MLFALYVVCTRLQCTKPNVAMVVIIVVKKYGTLTTKWAVASSNLGTNALAAQQNFSVNF